MELKGERQLARPRGTVWEALNDPEVLRAAIPGCEGFDLVAANHYALTMVSALGPVKARFRGKLFLEDVIEAERYTLRFEGEGGVAGFARGEARVVLADGTGGTLLTYAVASSVGGKIAQVGNRLVDGAARKLAEQFFAAFERELAAREAAP